MSYEREKFNSAALENALQKALRKRFTTPKFIKEGEDADKGSKVVSKETIVDLKSIPEQNKEKDKEEKEGD